MNTLTPDQIKVLHALPVKECMQYWDACERIGREHGKINQVVRALCLADLYYLLVRVCGRVDLMPCVNRKGFVDNQFMFDRCREVEANPNGNLDLWSREHGKSSVINFGLTLQNILQNPEVTIGIYSHTRPLAKSFLRTLMREIEENETLHAAFPDIFFGKDTRSYQKFSEDDGVIVKRKNNPNEATIEAWGLVDGQPTGKHHSILLYDDVVVASSVTTPEMIQKTMTALEQSFNLGTTPGIKRAIGTRWHYNDSYSTLIKRGTFKLREYPGRKGGTEEGDSYLWSEETHREKRAAMGPYTYACQILLNPKADALQGFKREWLRSYKSMSRAQMARMNVYILVDSANAKRKESDYTAMWVVGLNHDKNYYALDMIRDRLNLAERTDRLIALHRKFAGLGCNIVQVRYERYGIMADIDHIKSVQEQENYRFHITEVAGRTPKDDRIRRMLGIFEQGRFYLPQSLHVTDYEKIDRDLVHAFVEEEYMAFPVSAHKDMFDSLSRIAEPDLPLTWPQLAVKQFEPMDCHPTHAAYAV